MASTKPTSSSSVSSSKAAAAAAAAGKNEKVTQSTQPQDVITKEEKKAAGFWNMLANYYYKQPIKDEESYQRKLQMTRKYLTTQSTVLEFGCGTGGTALKHAKYVKHIDAIDSSSNMIDIAKRQMMESNNNDPKITNVNFQCAGITNYKPPVDTSSSYYDVVLGLSILHLLPNKDEVLHRVHDMIKSDGYFISSTTCMGDITNNFVGRRIIPIFSYIGLLPTINVFTKDELKASIENAGFLIVEEFQPGNEKDKAVFIVAKKIAKEE